MQLKKTSCNKAESAKFLEGKYFSDNEKGLDLKDLAPKLKKLELNRTNLELKHSKTCLNCAKKPYPSKSYGLKVKIKTIRVLLDSGLSGHLLFVKKGSIKHISIVKRVKNL
jgi:hypothetical protein